MLSIRQSYLVDRSVCTQAVGSCHSFGCADDTIVTSDTTIRIPSDCACLKLLARQTLHVCPYTNLLDASEALNSTGCCVTAWRDVEA